MEANSIDILKKIKRVDTHPDMYNKILLRIQQKRRPIIVPLYQVGIAAMLILGLLACEIVIVNHQKSDQNNQNGLDAIFLQHNNTFYHE
jgi:negative regulator of sigma E activity